MLLRFSLGEVERAKMLPVGLYSSFSLVRTFDESVAALTPQSTISGYVYPKLRVDRALIEV